MKLIQLQPVRRLAPVCALIGSLLPTGSQAADAVNPPIEDAVVQTAPPIPSTPTPAPTPLASPTQPGEAIAPAQLAPPAPPVQPVGQPPAEDQVGRSNRPPAVAPIFEQPGVLTPIGKYVLEPSMQFGYSSSNRVSLVG